MSELQLEMSLDKINNPFRKALAGGEFVFLAGVDIPSDVKSTSDAVDQLMPMAEEMWSFDDLHGGLALSDRPGAAWSSAETASALVQEKRNCNIFYLSGSGRDRAAVENELKLFAGAGVENIVTVSGDGAPLSLRECRSRKFTGSSESLTAACEAGCFFPGATFNPFNYHKETVLAGYENLKKKLACGSEFLVTQSGWDMLQMQSLMWYLLHNELYYPVIAGITFLTPERVEKILSNAVPGVTITRDYARMLESELSGSRAQFEAAQYSRLELQVSGLRLMGYSGVQISGLDYPGRANAVAKRIRTALKSFSTFDEWLREYNSRIGGVEINSGLHAFHIFDRVLRRDYPQDEPVQIKDPGKTVLSSSEKVGYALKKHLFKSSSRRSGFLKKLFAGCSGCDDCTLAEHEFICPRSCPKKLLSGPCGGVRGDGRCEVGDFECRYVKMARFRLKKLETGR